MRFVVGSNQSYKMVLTDAVGNQIFSIDNVINAQLVTYFGVDTGAANSYIFMLADSLHIKTVS